MNSTISAFATDASIVDLAVLRNYIFARLLKQEINTCGREANQINLHCKHCKLIVKVKLWNYVLDSTRNYWSILLVFFRFIFFIRKSYVIRTSTS